MAWLLLGGIGLVGTAYLTSEAKEFWDKTTKPLYDKIEKENKDSEERIKEEIRQADIERKKKLYKSHNDIRTKYNIKPKPIIILNNNTEEICTVIYVNHYMATNKDDAIRWAKKNINRDYFDGQVLNKLSTKKIDVGVNNSVELIARELEEYYIVLHINDKYIIFDQVKDAKINDLFKNDTQVDLGCRMFS